jgi:hypothetical protein
VHRNDYIALAINQLKTEGVYHSANSSAHEGIIVKYIIKYDARILAGYICQYLALVNTAINPQVPQKW